MASLAHYQASRNSLSGFSTEGLTPTDQIDAWREQLSARFGIADVSTNTAGSFRATIETLSASNLSLSRIFGDAMVFERAARHVARRDNNDFTIGLLVKGRGIVEQDGRGTNLAPGDTVLCDGKRPFRIQFDEPFEQLVFRCDRAQLEIHLPDADRRTAQKIEGRAALLSATANRFAAIPRHPKGLEAADSAIVQRTVETLALTLGSTFSRALALPPLLARIHAYIEENLSNPILTPESVAEHHQISRRRLYRLFEAAGDSAAAFIRGRRLARCQTLFSEDPYMQRNVSEVAFACGFSNATTFGRAFRTAFGMTPRDYRRLTRITS